MKILNGLKKAEFIVIVAAFITMVVSIFGQVLNRNFIKLSIGWIEELARYCMVVLVMFGVEVGLRTGGQLSMEIVTSRMKGIVKRVAALVVQALVTAFSCIVFVAAIPLVRAQLKSMQLSPGLRLPMAVPYSVVMATFAVASVVQIFILVRMAVAGDRKKEEAS
jgi:TRAP-type C4-dicarboxylate transport system permease small subunit